MMRKKVYEPCDECLCDRCAKNLGRLSGEERADGCAGCLNCEDYEVETECEDWEAIV